MPATPTIGIDSDALLALRDLELRVKVVVKGLWSGLHRSPFHGFSVEFSEYRQYSPGDDLRYLDWKALARTDRMYLKRNEDETNLRCFALLDASRSMAFSSRKHPKLEYARTLAATFAYFMLQQRDMMGFASFDDSIRECVLPRWRVGQFRRILAAIPTAASGVGTDLAAALQQASRLCRTRSMILLVSDLLEDSDHWMPAIRELKAVGHDIRIAQVLDPAELSLSYGETAYWHDLESDTRLHINPERERGAYLQRFGQHQLQLQTQLQALGIPMRSLTTDMPLDIALRELITARTATALSPNSVEAEA